MGAANPTARPKEIADYRANLIAGGMGGNDLEQRQYLEEKRTASRTMTLRPGRGRRRPRRAGP